VTVSFWLLDYLYCGLKYDIGFPDVRHLHDLSCSFFLNFNILYSFLLLVDVKNMVSIRLKSLLRQSDIFLWVNQV